MNEEKVYLYDTTLRDGTQGEGINFSAEEKIRIAKKLDEFGMDYIEGGWPGSNERDKEFFELAKKIKFQHARLVAFGATRKPGTTCEEKINFQLHALLKADTPTVAIFGKSWTLHVTEIMLNTLEENFSMIKDSVAYLKKHGREVVYDAEHFFDGYKANPDYAMATLIEAFNAGADFLVLCDTNGGSLTHEIGEITTAVKNVLEKIFVGQQKIRLGIHAHNDSGMAVANSIEAVRIGVIMVQGTVNSYGERCGNADLTTIISNLQLKMEKVCVPAEKLTGLTQLAHFVSETANKTPQKNQPYVGNSAFAHKGGIHVSGVEKRAWAYEHIKPGLVGNRTRTLVSDLSGKSNIRSKAVELGIELVGSEDGLSTIIQEVKRMEQIGYEYEAADGSLEILMQKLSGQFVPFFELIFFDVAIKKLGSNPSQVQATVKIRVNGQEKIDAASGDGPIDALDNALRKCLLEFYPKLASVYLSDYKVRVIPNGHRGTASMVRVLINTDDGKDVCGTVGVSTCIVDASWTALVDSYHYKLSKR